MSLSKTVILSILLVGLLGTGSYWFVVGDQGSREAGSAVLGWLGLAFVAIGLGIQWVQFTRSPRPTLTVSPTGLTDVRVSKNEISWSAIEDIRLVTLASNKWLEVTLKPGEETNLQLTRMVRSTKRANARLGFDGLWIDTMNLAWRHKVVSKLIAEYAKAHAGIVIDLELTP